MLFSTFRHSQEFAKMGVESHTVDSHLDLSGRILVAAQSTAS
jgi:hypothetical protein